jgi:uncharacterized membrane protein YjjB (DUF3815 family)
VTSIDKLTLALFMTAWCVGIAAWFYAMRYWMPMWLAGFRHREGHSGYRRKAHIGFAVFVGAIAVGLAAGSIAKHWGADWVG